MTRCSNHLIIFLILIIGLILIGSCDENDVSLEACGVSDPLRNLPWLNEIVANAETDNTGNYLGKIWLLEYESQEIFITNMALGSGGIKYWTFDCNGEIITPEDFTFNENASDSSIIFENTP